MAARPRNIEAIVVSPTWPVATFGYGLAAMASLEQYLKVFSRVHFLGLVDGPFTDSKRWSESDVDWIHVPTSLPPKWLRFLSSLPRRVPAIAMRFVRVAESVRKIILRIHAAAQDGQRHAVIIFEDVPPACLLPAIRDVLPKVAIAVRSHNVLTKGFDGLQFEGSLVHRLAWRLEIAKMERLERTVCNSVDRFWALSNDDAGEYVRRLSFSPHGILGVSLDTARYAAVETGDQNTVLWLGGMDTRKTAAVQEFIARKWPSIRAQVPEARLVLAGRNSEKVSNQSSGIVGLGFVQDDRTALRQGLVFVNPQRIGSGIKLKSVVAMLAGKVVVATPTGIEGVEGTHGQEFFVVDDLDAMARQIVTLLRNQSMALEVAQNARALAAERYCNEYLSRTVVPLLQEFADFAVAS